MKFCSVCAQPVMWSDTFARWCHIAHDGLPTWISDHTIEPVATRGSPFTRLARLGKLAPKVFR